VTDSAWESFRDFRSSFKEQVQKWDTAFAEQLLPLQRESSQKDTPAYPVETSVVYNTALDGVDRHDSIRLIVIGDNPGKAEQLQKNRRYLVGQSGKIAEGFFKKHPELDIDFRKNVIILNKTPVHTAKTKHLRYLMQNGDDPVKELLADSQHWMAVHTAQLHKSLAASGTRLWLVGYSELKDKGLFTLYRNSLRGAYTADGGFENAMCPEWDSVAVFQHFSMNCFLIDLNRAVAARQQPSGLSDTLDSLGAEHRRAIFGC
jgi:hypothetical protein